MDDTEFIKLNFANAEANVRAYDTKSQIVLASTALSFSPIMLAIHQLDTSPWVTARLGVLFSLFAIVLLLFLLVLAPASVKFSTSAKTKGGLFFLRRPDDYDPETYVDALAQADLKLEYANEVLALHRIRMVKNARFNRALYALLGYLTAICLYGAALTLRIF